MATKSYPFHAFISYLQVPDKSLAIALRQGLMSLGAKKHLLKFRALEVFRDEASASANGGLAQRILQGIDDSQFLVLLARPEITIRTTALAKNWIEEEITYWLNSKFSPGAKKIKNINIIICLVDGDLEWDYMNGEFDWNMTTCLNEILRDRFGKDPVWIDFRNIVKRWNEADEKQKSKILSLEDPDFLQKVAAVSAEIQGKSVDELIAQDRKSQLLWANVLIGGALLLLAAVFTAGFQYKNALENQRVAERNLKNFNYKRLEEILRNAVTYAEAGGELGQRKKNEMLDSAKRIVIQYESDTTFTAFQKRIETLSH